ncbi:MAG TPA: hypothetical protein PLR02_14335, partial [Rhodocyclaceae bacterium]|nr:hypothetical protein [Rhodocyclaceae bacterium]
MLELIVPFTPGRPPGQIQVRQIRGTRIGAPATTGRTQAHKRSNHVRPGSTAGPTQRATNTS